MKKKARDPDVIVALPCGYDIPTTRREMAALTRQPDWKHLRAVRDDRVFLADGNQYFNRPGPRLFDSLRILAEIFHPTIFAPAFEGNGWVKLGT